MDAQNYIDEIEEEEKRREIFRKISPDTLQRYSEMGIEIYN